MQNTTIIGDSIPRSLRGPLVIASGALLTALAAHVQVPVWPVPFTLQTLALFMVAATMTSRRAALSQGLYLALAALGAPVLAAPFTGATAGYLIAFPMAVWLMASMYERGQSLWRTVAIFTLGDAVVLALGTAWLAAFTHESLAAAATSGLLLFLPSEVLKIATATTASRLLQRR
jgi:biotin transport system substrate-specific component